MKKVLITGVSSGLGKYLTDALIKDGFRVIGIDNVFPESVLQEINEGGLVFYDQDLSRIDETITLLHRIIEEQDRIDVLINNAAILNFKFFRDYNYFEIVQKFKVNLISPIIISKFFLEHMLANKHGRMINISSISAFKGKETTSLYAASKSGINRFHQVLFREMRMINKSIDVTLNTICPDRIALPEFLAEFPGTNANTLIKPEAIYSLIIRMINRDVHGKIYMLPRFNWRRILRDSKVIKKIPVLNRLQNL